jgi:AcrR family transcriptional regulator
MARLSRLESQARTREQLLATARALFLRDGYFATSLDKVAEEAGYSKGAIYANFRSKNELCLAVIDDIRSEQAGQVAAALMSSADTEKRLSAFEDWAERVIGDAGWSNLEIEFATQLRHDPQLREAFAERGRALRARTAEAVTAAADQLGIALPMPAELISTALLSLGVGLGLQRTVDHDVSIKALSDSIRVLIGLSIPVTV